MASKSKWRRLEHGDKIRKGDQYLLFHKWHATHDVGRHVEWADYHYRRRVK